MPAIFADNAKVRLSAGAALVWFLYHDDRIRLWPLNDEKKKIMFFATFFFFFTALFIQLCLTAKAIRAPRLNPPAARSVCCVGLTAALNVELDGARCKNKPPVEPQRTQEPARCPPHHPPVYTVVSFIRAINLNIHLISSHYSTFISSL